MAQVELTAEQISLLSELLTIRACELAEHKKHLLAAQARGGDWQDYIDEQNRRMRLAEDVRRKLWDADVPATGETA